MVITVVYGATDAPPTLQEMQAHIGGYVEQVPPRTPALQIYCDEDGIAKNLPPNDLAGLLAGQPLRGNVVVLQGRSRWT